MQYKRRHYRVAKKQVEKTPDKGTFVSNKQLKKISCVAILLGILILVKGILIGHIACKIMNDSQNKNIFH